jgi:glycosidase
MGADGFRLDAVKYLIEEGGILENTASTFAFWGRFRDHVDAVAPEAFLVGEAWDATEVSASYVDAGLHTVFEFDLAGSMITSANQGQPGSVADQLVTVMDAYPFHQYATFLTNHDQMRVFSQLGANAGRNRVAAAVLLTLPGVPFLYYGEEVGMTSTWTHEDVRRPMQWTSGANAGFTTGTPWIGLGSNYATNNVATMAADEGSLWNHYRTLVQARAASVALQRGTYHRFSASQGQIYAFLRHHADQAVVAIHNVGSGNAGGWSLSAGASQLAPGQYDATDLITGAALSGLTVTNGGAIAGWIPAGSLAGQRSLLVELSPAGG